MKKQLLLLLLIMLPLSMCGEVYYINGLYYSLNESNHTATVSSYYGESMVGGAGEELYIPDEIMYNGEKYKVTSIGNRAFYCNRKYTSVIIGNNVETIEEEAFSSCEKLTSIKFGNRLSCIRSFAFAYCNKLNNIYIGETFPDLLSNAFYNTYPKEVEFHCAEIKHSFGYNVNKIIIGKEVTDINISIGSEQLTTLIVDKDNPRYDSRNDCNALIETEKNTLIVGGSKATIPNTVICIRDSAFFNRRNMKGIYIPQSVQSIGIDAFTGCPEITNIVVENNNPKYDSRNNCNGLIETATNTLITGCINTIIPNNVTNIGDRAFFNCYYLTKMEIPSEVNKIGNNAFSNCISLSSIVVPNNVTHIGKSVFQGCKKLVNVILPDRIETIEDGTFWGCNGLVSFSIPNSVTSIGNHAFSDCSNIDSLSIGEKVSSIGTRAFSYCPKLNHVYCYAEQVPNTEVDIFNSSLTANATLYVLPKSIEEYRSTKPWSVFANIVSFVPEYNLIYYIDGVVYKTYKIKQNEAINPEPTPVKEGYTFSGWSEIPETMPAHDVTVTGSFSINKYKLIYKVDGVDYKTYENEYGASVTPEPAPTKEGYNFSGWSEIPATMPAHDVTVTGTFTIVDPVTITAKSYSRKYGEENPSFEYTSEGAKLTGTPEITCEATPTSPIGEYPIVISKGTVTNYNDHYVNGVLTITKAPLTITAKSYSIKQGEALPTFDAEYAGFKNSETSSVLTMQPTITTSATSASAPGTYDIVVSDASATNYEISYVKGTLTITKADEVVVTAKSYSRKYGEANPTFEYTTSGATLSGTPSISCAATATSPVGEYDIVASKGTVTNYNVTYVNGKLTITKTPLTITAKSYTIKQGEALPTFEAEYSGFKNNETSAVLTSQPRITTSATSASEPGTYDIVVSGASATNYEISYVKGTLTISAVEVEPVTETETTTFSETVNENTDLSNTIIDNTYFTMNAENGDGYDATEQAIVLNSTTSAEQMNAVQNAEIGDATMQSNYNGIVFEVPAGNGTITVEAKTLGSHVLNVQIGSGEPNKITKSERGTADVPYNVTVPTYVYLYASTSGASSAPKRAAAANSVLLYSYKVNVVVNGIHVITTDNLENAKWYTLDGLQLQGKPTKKGLYIVNGRKVIVK